MERWRTNADIHEMQGVAYDTRSSVHGYHDDAVTANGHEWANFQPVPSVDQKTSPFVKNHPSPLHIVKSYNSAINYMRVYNSLELPRPFASSTKCAHKATAIVKDLNGR